MAEEGSINDDIAKAAVKKYLTLDNGFQYDCILLGCTHFPVLKAAIQNHVGDRVTIVDSAIETAKVVTSLLMEKKLFTTNAQANCHYLVTDSAERFTRIGKLFLGHGIELKNIEVVDPS